MSFPHQTHDFHRFSMNISRIFIHESQLFLDVSSFVSSHFWLDWSWNRTSPYFMRKTPWFSLDSPRFSLEFHDLLSFHHSQKTNIRETGANARKAVLIQFASCLAKWAEPPQSVGACEPYFIVFPWYAGLYGWPICSILCTVTLYEWYMNGILIYI
jgi:hypothetical protein